ncbi:MAG TPA: glycosyltransferase family 2 protein [Quisquiliibacterium sp.]|nr:glycosyltransferase family 2 protein [Quisquiliibacterium sp.]
MSPPSPALSVVVPVKNEERNVAPLLSEIEAALQGLLEFEVIYVDDGSDDGTPAALQAAAARHPCLRVVRHARSCGQSAAIHTGVKAARHGWIATLDGDGQNDPADIPALVEAAIAAAEEAARKRRSSAAGGADVAPKVLIAGHRVNRNDTWLRRLSSRIANRVRGGLLGDGTPDTGCGLKVFARDAFLELPFFDHMHRFLPALFLRQGGTVASVPVRHRPRTEGRSKYGVHNRLWVGIVDLVGVMWLQRRMKLPELTTVGATDATQSA